MGAGGHNEGANGRTLAVDTYRPLLTFRAVLHHAQLWGGVGHRPIKSSAIKQYSMCLNQVIPGNGMHR